MKKPTKRKSPAPVQHLVGLIHDYPITYQRIANANDVLLRCAAHLSCCVDHIQGIPAVKFPSNKMKRQYLSDLRSLAKLAIGARIYLQPNPSNHAAGASDASQAH